MGKRLLLIGMAFAVLGSPNTLRAADQNPLKLLNEGGKLSEADAARLEDQILKESDQLDDHVRLLGYWTLKSPESSHEAVLAGRARHILWLIENAPDSTVFQSNRSRIFLTGPLADPVGFQKGRALWIEKLAAGNDIRVQEGGAEWLRYGDPETADRFFAAGKNPRARGYFYGETLLGITARDFITDAPIDSSEEARQSPFAAKVRTLVEQSQEADLVSGAALGFGWQAGVLYADGKLDWDYTPTLKALIKRAQELDPANLEFYGLATELPKRGERPTRVLRIGGSVMQKRLIPGSQKQPIYPASARERGIQGTVRLNVLVGLDGKIVKMTEAGGPPELIQAAAQAVKNWQYQPAMLNGAPCYVVTVVEVQFTLYR